MKKTKKKQVALSIFDTLDS